MTGRGTWTDVLNSRHKASGRCAEDERILEHVQVAQDAFECAGDQALPAATPGDTAGLWGRADEAWIAGNLARAVEILDGLQVPDRHRHPLLTLGSILEEGFGG